jgi:hypothetical protein
MLFVDWDDGLEVNDPAIFMLRFIISSKLMEDKKEFLDGGNLGVLNEDPSGLGELIPNVLN